MICAESRESIMQVDQSLRQVSKVQEYKFYQILTNMKVHQYYSYWFTYVKIFIHRNKTIKTVLKYCIKEELLVENKNYYIICKAVNNFNIVIQVDVREAMISVIVLFSSHFKI